MNGSSEGSDALNELYWREEILQAMFWMRGEGIAAHVNAESLAAFLSADRATVVHQLNQLAADGYVEPLPTLVGTADVAYRLTSSGSAEGASRFREEFAELTRPTHGECGPDCWCHDAAHSGEPCPQHGADSYD